MYEASRVARSDIVIYGLVRITIIFYRGQPLALIKKKLIL